MSDWDLYVTFKENSLEISKIRFDLCLSIWSLLCNNRRQKMKTGVCTANLVNTFKPQTLKGTLLENV